MKYAYVATVNYNSFPSLPIVRRYKHIKQHKLLPFGPKYSIFKSLFYDILAF